MSYSRRFYKKGKSISRTLEIDEELYNRSFLIRDSLLEGLYELKKKYRIPIIYW